MKTIRKYDRVRSIVAILKRDCHLNRYDKQLNRVLTDYISKMWDLVSGSESRLWYSVKASIAININIRAELDYPNHDVGSLLFDRIHFSWNLVEISCLLRVYVRMSKAFPAETCVDACSSC